MDDNQNSGFPPFQISAGGDENESAGQPKFCLRYCPVHVLINVTGKTEFLRELVHTWPPQVYNSANRDGAKFGTLTECFTPAPLLSLPESPERFRLQTPNTETGWDDDQTEFYGAPPGTISSTWTRER